MSDPCDPKTFKCPRAARLLADVCEHGSLTIQFLDKDGRTFAMAHCELEEAIRLLSDLAVKFAPFLGFDTELQEDGPQRGHA